VSVRGAPEPGCKWGHGRGATRPLPGGVGHVSGCRSRGKGRRAAGRATAVPHQARAAGARSPGGRSRRQQEKLRFPGKLTATAEPGAEGWGSQMLDPGGRGGCGLEGRGPASERRGREGVNERGLQKRGYPAEVGVSRPPRRLTSDLPVSRGGGVRLNRDERGRWHQWRAWGTGQSQRCPPPQGWE
jgi:hypothetical protein